MNSVRYATTDELYLAQTAFLSSAWPSLRLCSAEISSSTSGVMMTRTRQLSGPRFAKVWTVPAETKASSPVW